LVEELMKPGQLSLKVAR
jgi:hypothetical protein